MLGSGIPFCGLGSLGVLGLVKIRLLVYYRIELIFVGILVGTRGCVGLYDNQMILGCEFGG